MALARNHLRKQSLSAVISILSAFACVSSASAMDIACPLDDVSEMRENTRRLLENTKFALVADGTENDFFSVDFLLPLTFEGRDFAGLNLTVFRTPVDRKGTHFEEFPYYANLVMDAGLAHITEAYGILSGFDVATSTLPNAKLSISYGAPCAQTMVAPMPLLLEAARQDNSLLTFLDNVQ